MSARWQIGDTARCVDVSDIRLPLRTTVCGGGRYLTLGADYAVRGMSVSYGTELCLDVGAEYGPKLARRFVKVPPGGADASAERAAKVPA